MKFWRYVICVFAYVCLGALMFTAFGFSAQEGEKSDDVSKKVTSVVTGKSIEEIDKLEAEKGDDKVTANGIIRKCAHFSIYLLMGIFAYIAIFSTLGKNDALCIAIALAICLIYASSDEIHQYFSGGRTATARDVLLDFAGADIGIFLTYSVKDKIFDKFFGGMNYGKNS